MIANPMTLRSLELDLLGLTNILWKQKDDPMARQMPMGIGYEKVSLKLWNV